MSRFRDEEQERQGSLKAKLFSPEACTPGLYGGVPREFALAVGRSSENLWQGIRREALTYFGERRIAWHDGIDGEIDSGTKRGPSNHLCCSQSACVNAWFPFVREPEGLVAVLRAIGYEAAEMLPVTLDETLPDGTQPFVGFEWIGKRNYLGEGPGGRPLVDCDRTRGKNVTSADLIVRFRDDRGRVHVVLGDWKYTEVYPVSKGAPTSARGSAWLDTYGPALKAAGCQLRLGGLGFDHLLVDPFDHMMRLQLLASAMEREHEMGANIVSTLHMAPAANEALCKRITSPGMRSLGSSLHRVWGALVPDGRFRGVRTEELLSALLANAPDAAWRDYMALRYRREPLGG